MPAPSSRPAVLPLDAIDADRYLRRLGLERTDVETGDLSVLERLMLAHLTEVPFENLDQVFAGGVDHDLAAALDKILAGRGGWCFELNGSFARLLAHLGYDVLQLGCAVLLDGPTQVVDHLALEISGGPASIAPVLVDVGFGDSFVTPLELNRRGPQPGGNGDYELIGSPQGTTLTRHVDGVPEAQYRFKRVALDFDHFAEAAHRLQTDPSLHWSSKPFASRLRGVEERITLRHDMASRITPTSTERHPVESHAEWDERLRAWFDMARPGPWPNDIT